MSHVTDIMIRCGLYDDAPVIRALNAWLLENNHEHLTEATIMDTSKPVGERCTWGGEKAPQLDLWVGSFNYLDFEEFKAVFEKATWKYKYEIQLFVSAENDRTFGVWMFCFAGTGRVLRYGDDETDCFLHCVLPPVSE